MDFKQNGIAVLIPAYKPEGQRLVNLVKAVIADRYASVIIVDDGGGEEFADVFGVLEKMGCIVVRHPENMGKGRALKTGLTEYQKRFPEGIGVVTADADGQHLPEDIARTAQALAENPDKLVLGCRTLGREMPLASRFGNKLTRGFFRLVSGVSVSDTQTGLRGIPAAFLDKIAALKGERYEFEMHMLLELKPMGLGHIEVPIQTIYLDGNQSSHFNRIKDSFLIYKMFFSYIFIGLASFVVDYGLFSAMNLFLPAVMNNPKRLVFGLPLVVIISNLTARGLSSVFNFSLNRKVMLPENHKGQGVLHQAAKYYLLVVVAMLADTLLVSSLSLVISKYIAKIIVSFLIFMCNFFIQKRVVYV